jgi:hypothetical protein
VLREIARGTEPGSFSKQLDHITQQYGTSFAEALSRFNEPMRTDPPSKIDTFFAKREADGRTSVAIQQFLVRSSQRADGRWDHRMEVGERLIKLDRAMLSAEQIQAYWSVPPECVVDVARAPPIPHGREADWIKDLFRTVAGQSPQCSAQIGGPIRIAIVDANGIRWLAE